MDESNNDGILTAVSLVVAALVTLLDESKPFTAVFPIDTLPTVLQKKLEERSEGVIVTATIIKKRDEGASLHVEMTDKEFGAIMLNKERDYFGLREKFDKDELE